LERSGRASLPAKAALAFAGGLLALQALADPRKDAREAERALERAYAAALEQRTGNAAAALRAAQEAWVGYRRAHLGARYPAPATEYGSIHPTCLALLAAELARQRAAELERRGGCAGEAAGAASADSLRAIRESYAGETAFLARLEAAQRAWERFRDLELRALGAAPGRAQAAVCRAALDARRARHLEPWLAGVPEGDACAGSLRRKAGAGTVRSMVAGDRACYVVFTDDEGRSHEEMADFAICEQTALLGKRVRFEWDIASVQAASCQGNPDCRDSETVALIRSATPEARR
jgi:uncharacterized protein YecT (DUF1311 family)